MNRNNIDEELIEELQALSKIRLNADEKDRVKEDFANILNYIDILDECDASTNEEMFISDPITGCLRDDKIADGYNINQLGREITVPEVL